MISFFFSSIKMAIVAIDPGDIHTVITVMESKRELFKTSLLCVREKDEVKRIQTFLNELENCFAKIPLDSVIIIE